MLMSNFSSWNDRVPFVLFFNIATSSDLFQSKLPRETIRLLTGSEFHVKRVEAERLFRLMNNESSILFCGPTLSHVVLQRQSDFVQSPTALTRSLKVPIIH